jgi:energy-coupling factor transporter ATP-binding protein EcfA2
MGAPAPVVLIDGRSGSGKTELATLIAAAWPDAQLVRLDDMYPGWDGLDAASAALTHTLLPHRRWQRWDWETDRPAEWHRLEAGRPILIEGCGALSVASRAQAQAAIWVELDTVTRKQRALARDGSLYAPHWERWAQQEDMFIAREYPQALADLIVDGTNVAAAAPAWHALLRSVGVFGALGSAGLLATPRGEVVDAHAQPSE